MAAKAIADEEAASAAPSRSRQGAPLPLVIR